MAAALLEAEDRLRRSDVTRVEVEGRLRKSDGARIEAEDRLRRSEVDGRVARLRLVLRGAERCAQHVTPSPSPSPHPSPNPNPEPQTQP